MLERECLNRTITALKLGEDTTRIELPGANQLWSIANSLRPGAVTGLSIRFDEPDDPSDHTKLLTSSEYDRRLAHLRPPLRECDHEREGRRTNRLLL